MSHFAPISLTRDISVTAIVPKDLPDVVKMLQELATYEKVEAPVRSSVESLNMAIFGPSSRLFGFIARQAGEPMGIILAYETYSTFSASTKIFIEDFVVRASCRSCGVGRALLAALARRCLEGGYAGLHWRVLDSNVGAIRFYNGLGAIVSTEHRYCLLAGAALESVAEGGLARTDTDTARCTR